MGDFFMGISIIRSYVKNRKLDFSSIVITVLVCINVISVWSATSLAGLCFCILVILLSLYKALPSIFNYKTVLSASVTATLLIVVFQVQQIFSFVIKNVLHKELSFSGRVSIWNQSLFYILQSPWIGNGSEENQALIRKIVLESTHNFYLQTMYNVGVLGMLFVAAWLIYFGCELKKGQSKQMYGIILGVMSYFLVIWTAESTYGKVLSFIICLSILGSNIAQLENCRLIVKRK